eukprot:scaffold1129_cov164-Ochromonas_danica.AAC.16
MLPLALLSLVSLLCVFLPDLGVSLRHCQIKPSSTASLGGRRWLASTSPEGVEEDLAAEHKLQSLRHRLQSLALEREKKEVELLAAEMAITALQKEILAIETNHSVANVHPIDDYGFVSRSAGSQVPSMPTGIKDSSVPPNAFFLAWDSLHRELSYALDSSLKEKGSQLEAVRVYLRDLQLSNEQIWQRERQSTQPVRSPWIIKGPYLILCYLLDALFQGKPISRFYFLETVARMPYFSYITMLHTYETLGWWRRSTQAKRVHFAEEYNEYHHLMIWESLGGDQDWHVRFLAQHAAIVYFFIMLFLWICSPSLAYNFSELIETHAVHTYTEFAESNKERLQSLAAPKVAKEYYESPDLYVFDEFQTQRTRGSRRVVVNTLYDTVCAIRDDEAEHVYTMKQCQNPETILRSPNTEAAIVAISLASTLVAALLASSPSLMTDIDATNMMEGLTRAGGKTFSSLQEMNTNMEPIQQEEESILEQLFTRLVELFRL